MRTIEVGAAELLQKPLAQLEERLTELVRSPVNFIELIGEDLVGAGGKRARPMLALLVMQAFGLEIGKRELDFAAAIELLHSATLLHDDLVDDAETRRGHEAAFRRYGNAVSVLSGDFLLSNVLEILATLPSEFTSLIARTARQICEGEVLQFQMAALAEYSLTTYVEIITGKTAALASAATGGAAMLARMAGLAGEREVEAMFAFGLDYGRAFQLQDDLLDLLGEETTLGKPIAGDLREGKATFLVLDLLEHARADVVSELRAILSRGASEPADIARVRQFVHEHGSLERARLVLERYASQARFQLNLLGSSASRSALFRLLDEAIWRVA